MALADSKKAQTVVNLLHERVTSKITEANAVAAALRQAVIDNSLQGEFSAGELTALQTFVSDLSSLAGSAVVVGMANRYVPSHRSEAVTIIGVND